MIIARYLTRELVHSLLGIMVVLLLIVICTMFVHYLGVAASGTMTGMMVLKLLGLTLPRYVATLLPISLFLAILLTYGRLFANKELLVMMACGLSWRRLLWITLLPASVLFVCVLFLSLYVVPRMSVHTEELTQSAASSDNLELLKPGRFIALPGGQVIYIGDIANDAQTVSNLFLYRDPGAASLPQIVIAPSGHQMTDPKTGQNYLVLDDGRVYKAKQGQVNYQVIDFKSYATRIAAPVFQSSNRQLDATSTMSLVTGSDTDYQFLSRVAELQWRFTMPLAVIILTVLGVAFCYVQPRQGRYTKLIPGILIFIIYFNLTTVSKSWLVQGKLAPWIGVWWVHVFFFLVGVLWLYRADGYRWYRLSRRA